MADLVKPTLPVREEGDDPEDLAILTPEQVVIMEMAAVETPYYTLIYLEVRTGLRRSEILALRWMDVDLKKGLLFAGSSTIRTETAFPSGRPKRKRTGAPLTYRRKLYKP